MTLTTRIASQSPTRLIRQAAAERSRHRAVLAVAAASIVVLGWRITLPQGVEVGWIVAALLSPVWVRAVGRYRFGWLLVGLSLATAVAGVWLRFANAATHGTNGLVFTTQTGIMIGAGLSIGLLLWARTLFSPSLVAILFGIGLLIGTDVQNSAFQGNPWKFGFYYPVALIALGLAHLTRRWWVELLVLVALMLMCATHDFRSSFALLLLAAVLLIAQRPVLRVLHRGSTLLVLLGIAVATVVVTFVGQAAILGGLLGAETQARSIAQIETSGNLIVGSRPELQATLALMQNSLWGFGAGSAPTGADIEIAKTGMRSIGYDPDNGYVNVYMLGNHFEVHSIFGDVWIQSGLVGLALIAALLVVLLWSTSRRIAQGTAPAATLLMVVTTLWFVPFGPWFSSSPIVVIAVALLLEVKRRGGDADRPRESSAELPRWKRVAPGFSPD